MIIVKHYLTIIKASTMAVIIFSVAGNWVFAQEVDSTATEIEQVIIPIEQITVTGQRSFFLLRAQVEFAKEQLYSTYNDFNEDDEYDVNCKKSDWTGTRIQEHQCWPVFFERLVAENAQDALIDGDFFVNTVPQLARKHSNRFDDLRANMIKVANESSSVAEALTELGTLEEALERKKDECMKQAAILFIFRLCP